MQDQVRDISIDSVLRDESRCRAGGGDDASSPTCRDALVRVIRYTSGALAGQLQAVAVNPINVAEETTDGIDAAANFRLPTAAIGEFALSGGYTHVFNHTVRRYPGDPIIDKFALDSNFDIPREKGTASLTWSLGGFLNHAHRPALGQAAQLRPRCFHQGKLSVQPLGPLRPERTPSPDRHRHQPVRSGAGARPDLCVLSLLRHLLVRRHRPQLCSAADPEDAWQAAVRRDPKTVIVAPDLI
ncbi:hypothetical protein [Sphingomonas sp. T9W2]|uniref:hypothetical protein n=1 Tax=Sphingomonas sp. T9W2 TaxID=3143183 RepID=UPI0031F5D71E